MANVIQAVLGFKLSNLLTILTAAAVLLIVWAGTMRCSNYFHPTIKKFSSSCLAFIMLNLVAAAIFLSNSRSSCNIGKSNPFAEHFLPPLIRCQAVVEGVSEGADTMDNGDQDKGDFEACTLMLMTRHEQVDLIVHEDSDGGGVYYSENGSYDGNDHHENDNEEEDDDDDDIDPIDLQKRSQEFIGKIVQGWMIEKLRDGLMHPP